MSHTQAAANLTYAIGEMQKADKAGDVNRRRALLAAIDALKLQETQAWRAKVRTI